MTEQAEVIREILIRKREVGTSAAQDGMPTEIASGSSAFKPSKPQNLVRPQGVKPPPPGRTK